jgi:hypothetical protein
MNYRLPIEILGNTGMVPLYKDVRNVTNKWIYQELDKELDAQRDGDGGGEVQIMGMNKSDLKRYHPELYEKYYGEGTQEAAEREIEREKKAAERAIKDALYGYEPSVSRRKDRKEYRSTRSSTRSSRRSSSRSSRRQ